MLALNVKLFFYKLYKCNKVVFRFQDIIILNHYDRTNWQGSKQSENRRGNFMIIWIQLWFKGWQTDISLSTKLCNVFDDACCVRLIMIPRLNFEESPFRMLTMLFKLLIIINYLYLLADVLNFNEERKHTSDALWPHWLKLWPPML
jgi:hypothetical protein